MKWQSLCWTHIKSLNPSTTRFTDGITETLGIEEFALGHIGSGRVQKGTQVCLTSKLRSKNISLKLLGERVCSVAQAYLTLRPHGLWPTRLHCPWDFPGKNTGVGCHSLSRGSSWPRDQNCVSCISWIGRWILYLWTTNFIQKISGLPQSMHLCAPTLSLRNWTISLVLIKKYIYWDLSALPRVEPTAPACGLAAWSLNHWTARETPELSLSAIEVVSVAS